MILGDVGYHLTDEASLSTRLVASLLGVHGRFGPTPDFRWTIRNDRTGRASVRRILERELDRPVLGHGSMIEIDGREAFLTGFEQVP